jgi:hypothetical protein
MHWMQLATTNESLDLDHLERVFDAPFTAQFDEFFHG